MEKLDDETFRCPKCGAIVRLAVKPKPGRVYTRRCKCKETFMVTVPEGEKV